MKLHNTAAAAVVVCAVLDVAIAAANAAATDESEISLLRTGAGRRTTTEDLVLEAANAAAATDDNNGISLLRTGAGRRTTTEDLILEEYDGGGLDETQQQETQEEAQEEQQFEGDSQGDGDWFNPLWYDTPTGEDPNSGDFDSGDHANVWWIEEQESRKKDKNNGGGGGGGGGGYRPDASVGMANLQSSDGFCPAARPSGGRTQVAKVSGKTVSESSGLVAGRRNTNILFTHNDRGSGPNLYAINQDTGAVVKTYKISGSGVKSIDWEDISMGPCPSTSNQPHCIFICDIGDNFYNRGSVQIYRVEEPPISIGVATLQADKLTLRYPDGAKNAEACMVDPDTSHVYIIQKTSGTSNIYKSQAPWNQSGGRNMNMVKVGSVNTEKTSSKWGHALVAADISADGRQMLILYYGKLDYYCRNKGESIEDALSRRGLALTDYVEQPQGGEGIAFASNMRGYYTMQESGGWNEVPLYRYPAIFPAPAPAAPAPTPKPPTAKPPTARPPQTPQNGELGGDIDWFRGTNEGGKKFDILQCQNMVVDWSNNVNRDGQSHSIWEFNNEEAYKNCDKSQATRIIGATPSATHVIGMDNTKTVEKRWFGSLENDDCTAGRMKFALKVRPRLQHKFPGYECDGATTMKVKTTESVVACRRLCKKLRNCYAIQYNNKQRCRIYSGQPTRLVESNQGTTCEVAAQSCDQGAKLALSAVNKNTKADSGEIIG